MDIKIGMTATVTQTVKKENAASAVGSGCLDVFATPSMIALMEMASFKAIEEGLDEGSTTVGTLVNVEHLSATPLGMQISVKSTVTAVDGRKVCFDVEAYDEVGLIGKGKHERFVVFSEKFMLKTQSKGK